MSKPTLSATGLNTLHRCGMQYYFRYIEGIRSPPGVAAVVGKGAHRAIELNLISKRDAGGMLTEEHIKDLATDATNQYWNSDAPMLTPDEIALGKDRVLGQALESARGFALAHRKLVAPAIHPVHLEREFRLDVDGYPFDIIGYIDIQEPTRIRDTKTKGKAPPKDAADKSLQLSVYDMAIEAIDGRKPDELVLDNLIAGKGGPRYEPQATRRGEADRRALFRRLDAAANVIEKQTFLPAPPDAWCCSERWCGYWQDNCDYGRRARVSATGGVYQIRRVSEAPVTPRPGRAGGDTGVADDAEFF